MRIGVDLGGTKIEGVVVTPQGDYRATLEAITGVVRRLEAAVGCQNLPVGVGHPGAISPSTGHLKNSNSTCLNGRPFQQDLEAVLGLEIYLANDADCLAVSEARDGAAAGAANVFAVILGTGVGGGIAIGGRLLRGPNAIAGEWGHNPLPWIRPDWEELPGVECWCGRHGCIETWLSGVGLVRDHERVTAERLSGEAIVQRAAATLSRCEDRLDASSEPEGPLCPSENEMIDPAEPGAAIHEDRDPRAGTRYRPSRRAGPRTGVLSYCTRGGKSLFPRCLSTRSRLEFQNQSLTIP